jgi:hypothetical protein
MRWRDEGADREDDYRGGDTARCGGRDAEPVDQSLAQQQGRDRSQGYGDAQTGRDSGSGAYDDLLEHRGSTCRGVSCVGG